MTSRGKSLPTITIVSVPSIPRYSPKLYAMPDYVFPFLDTVDWPRLSPTQERQNSPVGEGVVGAPETQNRSEGAYDLESY